MDIASSLQTAEVSLETQESETTLPLTEMGTRTDIDKLPAFSHSPPLLSFANEATIFEVRRRCHQGLNQCL